MSRRRSSLVLLALAYVGFVSLGLPDGILGVAWPSMRGSFGLALDAIGPLLAAFTVGYVLSSFASGWLLARMSVGTLLAASCAATGGALLGYAASPVWALVVALGVLAGMGSGAIDAGVNTYAATFHGPRTITWLHACWGIGATAGPVLMTAVLAADRDWRLGYTIVGVAQLALAATFAASRSLWPPPRTSATGPPAAVATPRGTLRLPVAWLGIAIFFVYTGLEAAAGAFAYTLLTEGRGMAPASAGSAAAAYWAALMLGRVLYGFAVGFDVRAAPLFPWIVALAAGYALLGVSSSPAIGAAGLVLAGFASGPIFPALIAATPARTGSAHTANAVGFQIAAASLGQSVVPWTVGAMARHQGLETIGPALFSGAVLLLGLHRLLPTAARRPTVSAEVVASGTEG